MKVNKTTYMARPDEVEAEWLVVDAADKVVGRLATRIATILQGKHKPTYTPHVLCGDFVVVTNASRVVFTGRKWTDKTYGRYSGYPGGLKLKTAEEVRQTTPERILIEAVKRMLPKTRLGRKMLKRMKVYAGPEHPHDAQNPKPLAL